MRAALKKAYSGRGRSGTKTIYFSRVKRSTRVAGMAGLELARLREIELLLALEDSRKKLIAGHFPFSRAAYENHRETTLFFSVFRHPVSRFLSGYFYNRYKESDHRKIEMSLDAFLENEAGRGASRLYVDAFGKGGAGGSPDAPASLDAALGNLKTLNLIGILEDMARVHAVLEATLGCRLAIPRLRPNPRSSYEKEVSRAQLARIEEMCADDIRFYEEACRLKS